MYWQSFLRSWQMWTPSPAVPLCRLLQVALTVRTRGVGGGTHRKKSPALRSRLGRFFLGAVSGERSGGAREGSSVSWEGSVDFCRAESRSIYPVWRWGKKNKKTAFLKLECKSCDKAYCLDDGRQCFYQNGWKEKLNIMYLIIQSERKKTGWLSDKSRSDTIEPRQAFLSIEEARLVLVSNSNRSSSNDTVIMKMMLSAFTKRHPLKSATRRAVNF